MDSEIWICYVFSSCSDVCVCVCVNHIYIKISKQLKIRGSSHIVKANFSISVQCQKLYFRVDCYFMTQLLPFPLPPG